jgi:hypothetical protein
VKWKLCAFANAPVWICSALRLSSDRMLTINISWEFFLGILGTLIALAYYANGRFTRLETNFDWFADAVRDLASMRATLPSRTCRSSIRPASVSPSLRHDERGQERSMCPESSSFRSSPASIRILAKFAAYYNGTAPAADEPTIAHPNIRGPRYFH